jgi:hypothetical protein
MLTRGTPVILDDVDCPEAKLVAVLERYDDKSGIWHARYLSPATSMVKCWTSGSLGHPTPLDVFGVRLETKDGKYRVLPVGDSKADYRDGVRRNWQGRTDGKHWRDARKKALGLLVE